MTEVTWLENTKLNPNTDKELLEKSCTLHSFHVSIRRRFVRTSSAVRHDDYSNRKLLVQEMSC